MLLDPRLIGRDTLSGGKKSSADSSETRVEQESLPSTMAKTSSFRRKQSQFQVDSATIEPINKLINKFSQRLDPIDWTTYEPCPWENEKESYKRCVVLFGFVVQLNHMYTGAVQKLPAKTSTRLKYFEVLSGSKIQVYLPISSRRSFSYCEGSRPFDQSLHVPLVQRDG